MLFYKNYIVYYTVCGVFIEKYVCTKFHCNCVSESHGHICHYCNVLPGAAYCCFTRTTLFTTLFVVCSVKRFIPIVMYCLRLFIVVLQELHCLLNCLHVCMIIV